MTLAPLNGKTALVCGASAGIGRATATTLAAQGARIVALARSEGKLAALIDTLPGEGHRALVADLDDRDALAQKIADLLAQVGAVQILVNNTGGPPPGPILQATADDFMVALGRHLLASHLLVQRLLPGMVDSGYGRIINVISTSIREPIPGLGVSNTTRGAVASWAKSLANELPPGVTINNVLPGFTDTERLDGLRAFLAAKSGRSLDEVQAGWMARVPEGRLIRPEETAATIAFLASPAAGGIRGASLAVDGGRMRSI